MARTTFADLDSQLDGIAVSLQHLSQRLNDHRKNTWISASASHPPQSGTDKNSVHFAAEDYPTLETLAEALNAWHDARQTLLHAFAALPKGLREDLDAPPGLHRWELDDYR